MFEYGTRGPSNPVMDAEESKSEVDESMPVTTERVMSKGVGDLGSIKKSMKFELNRPRALTPLEYNVASLEPMGTHVTPMKPSTGLSELTGVRIRRRSGATPPTTPLSAMKR